MILDVHKLKLITILSIILGYIVSIIFYGKKYFTSNQFILITISVALMLLSMVMILKPSSGRGRFPSVKLGRGAIWIFPGLVFLVVLCEAYCYGSLEFLSIVIMISVFVILSMVHQRNLVVFIAFSILSELIVVLYGMYVPIFGADTWRFATLAKQIIERGGLKDVTLIEEAYPFPVLSILFSMYAIVAQIGVEWSNVVMGFAYLLLLSIWMYVLGKRFDSELAHLCVLLTHSIHLLVVWSTGIIPQAFALLQALPLIFLDLKYFILLIMSIILTMSHGGVALWTIGILIFLTIVEKLLRTSDETINLSWSKLGIPLSTFLIILTYTTLSAALSGGITYVLNVLRAFIYGEKLYVSPIMQPAPVTSILWAIPLAVVSMLAFIVLLEDKSVLVKLLTLLSLAGLVFTFISMVTGIISLDIPRYVGMPSAAILVLIAVKGVRILLNHGRPSTLYAIFLVLLAFVSSVFGGALMPENPYTANPYAPWTLSGLLRYSEARELDSLANLLYRGNYIVDWRAAAYLMYSYVWIEQGFKGFYYNYYPERGVTLMYAGSYAFLADLKLLKKYDAMLIFRNSATQMLGLYSQELISCIKNMSICASNEGLAVVYSSKNIYVLGHL